LLGVKALKATLSARAAANAIELRVMFANMLLLLTTSRPPAS
jgi:hypothetical protein